jgi:CRP-like cAMP-binding protein
LFLVELLLGQPTSSSVRTTSDATLWVVKDTALLRLAASRPDLVLELGLKLSQTMQGKVEVLEAVIEVR